MTAMATTVKRARRPVRAAPSGRGGAADSGRVAQRRRTRKAIVEAAMRLMADGRTPTIAEVAEAADVSRRTIYMYFPTLEHLLLDATLGALGATAIEPVVRRSAGSDDPVVGIDQLSRAVNRGAADTMHLGRALIRLTVEAEEPADGAPRRGYRRVEWIERALEPLRERLPREAYERLVSVLSILMGWEPLVALRDVRGVKQKRAEDLLAWAARALVERALAEARPRVRRRL